MKRKFLTALLAAATALSGFGLATYAPASAQSLSAPTRTVTVALGRGQLLSLPATISDIFLSNDAVADVKVKSSRQLFIFGKAPGETTLFASNAAGDVVYSATIRVGGNFESVDDMLKLAMPDSEIVTTPMNGTILLTGTVSQIADAAEAERLVAAFTGANVISRLKTATPLQVNLHVRFAEVSRSLVRELGSNLTTRDTSDGFQFGIVRGRSGAVAISPQPTAGLPVLDASAQFGLPAGTISLPFNPTTGQFVTATSPGVGAFTGIAGQSAIGLFGRLFGLDVGAAFDLAERSGLLTTLSRPNLTAISGQTATFLAGGEIPIPISNGDNGISVTYREYGVRLAYTPTVIANGRIRLAVSPEVSELTSQGAVQLDGFSIPGIATRRASTTVELGSGESFMIAGLLSNNANSTIEKTPGAGDVPILGNLFRSTSFRRGETELVIVVTPYLVKPVTDSEIKLPTDGYQSPNIAEQLITFQQDAGKSGAERPLPQAVESASPLPGISAAPQSAPVPAQRGNDRDRTNRDKGKRDVARANPGFSFE